MSALVDDLDTVVAAAVAALRAGTDRDWHVPARGLAWDCWETVEHTADDLFAYAGTCQSRPVASRSAATASATTMSRSSTSALTVRLLRLAGS